jgi:hypothetical protein
VGGFLLFRILTAVSVSVPDQIDGVSRISTGPLATQTDQAIKQSGLNDYHAVGGLYGTQDAPEFLFIAAKALRRPRTIARRSSRRRWPQQRGRARPGPHPDHDRGARGRVVQLRPHDGEGHHRRRAACGTMERRWALCSGSATAALVDFAADVHEAVVG